MKKNQQSFLEKIFPFSRKNQEKRAPRNYTALVENFKTKVQVH
ncbi:hypothetical protein [Polaribacter haliotis]|nr:hypothetical protein [Polaribacter haliotis]